MDKQIFEPMFQNPWVMAIVKITILMYASQVAPKLPTFVEGLLKNTFVKIIALALIIFAAQADLQLAVLLAIAYVLTVNVMSGRKILESFSDYSTDYVSYGDQKLVEPKSILYPGCENVKLADLVAAFDGKKEELTKNVMYTYKELLEKYKDTETAAKIKRLARAAGLPNNIELNDANAPHVATLLMYYGFQINDTCKPPQ